MSLPAFPHQASPKGWHTAAETPPSTPDGFRPPFSSTAGPVSNPRPTNGIDGFPQNHSAFLQFKGYLFPLMNE
jgi:hypothetical protein